MKKYFFLKKVFIVIGFQLFFKFKLYIEQRTIYVLEYQNKNINIWEKTIIRFKWTGENDETAWKLHEYILIGIEYNIFTIFNISRKFSSETELITH